MNYLAIDLGAESCRVMLGKVGGKAIELEELHRFPTATARVFGSMRWNVLSIFEQVKVGLAQAAKHEPITSVSCDSWGVDYVLVKAGHPCLTPPFMHRDERNQRPFAQTADEPTRGLIFENTGIQSMPINTLYQLLADQQQSPGLHEFADGLLLTGDYFNYLLSGVGRAERSLASTTQLYNPRSGQWAQPLIDRFNFRGELFPPIVDSGTRLGPIDKQITTETGLGGDTQVVAGCSHDTANAVAATPMRAEGCAFLSSGTWSLVGVEVDQPIITDRCRALNFTNEVGFGNKIRLLKNISGLFMVQESRKDFAADGQSLSYADLADLAGDIEPMRSLIRPDAAEFVKPGEMTDKIADACRRTDQPVPESPGQFVRCIYDSLALLYREQLTHLEELTGVSIRTFHIVGGGSRSDLFNRLIADVTGRTVIAGPAEATAVGNIGIQAIAVGELEHIEDLRRCVRSSFELQTIEPRLTDLAQTVDRFHHLR